MKKYLLCILVNTALFTSAQNPSNDKNWVLNESLSDEFNGTTINQEKWSSTHHWGTCEDKGKKTAYRYDETPQASHFSLSNGVLTLKAIKEKCTCKEMDWDSNKYKYYNAYYSEGALFSKRNRFKYGYFEIRCRFPNAYKFKGINPSFWLYGQTTGDNTSWSEIDIYEFNGTCFLLVAVLIAVSIWRVIHISAKVLNEYSLSLLYPLIAPYKPSIPSCSMSSLSPPTKKYILDFALM